MYRMDCTVEDYLLRLYVSGLDLTDVVELKRCGILSPA